MLRLKNRMWQYALALVIILSSKLIADAQSDTVIVKLRGAQKLMIIANPAQPGVGGLKQIDLNEIVARIDSLLQNSVNANGQTVVQLKDSSVILKKGTSRQRSVSVHFQNGPSRTITVYDSHNGDTLFRHRPKNRHFRYEPKETRFYINIGLNSYASPAGNFPDADNAPYALRPLGSRYVALGYNRNLRFGHSPFSLNLGVEIAWNNFMLQNDSLIGKDDNGVTFKAAQRGFIDKIEVDKSKFVLATLKIPVTLRARLRKHLTLDAGGFVGYRLDSYSKLKYDRSGSSNKDHYHSSFYLSNFQYGIKAQLTFRNVGAFAEYNLNPLFSAGRGPDLRVFSFGISL